MYRRGAFAFDDVTDKGAKRRAEHTILPRPKKACREGTHLFSEYVETKRREGMEVIVARCPDCRETFTFPALAKDRRT